MNQKTEKWVGSPITNPNERDGGEKRNWQWEMGP